MDLMMSMTCWVVSVCLSSCSLLCWFDCVVLHYDQRFGLDYELNFPIKIHLYVSSL